MEAESFFARWSKQKTKTAPELTDAAAEPVGADQPEQVLPPPSIEDVAALTSQSDYTRFIAKGVDENIKRSALKKLFTDPHFNIMDGLDTYIEDYNKFKPIPPEMLALLNHAKGLLDPLSQFEQPLMRLMETAVPPEQAPPDERSEAGENAVNTESASVAAETPPPHETEPDPDLPMPDDGPPPQTFTEPDDDHKI